MSCEILIYILLPGNKIPGLQVAGITCNPDRTWTKCWLLWFNPQQSVIVHFQVLQSVKIILDRDYLDCLK